MREAKDKAELPPVHGIIMPLGSAEQPHLIAPSDWETNGVDYGAFCKCGKCGLVERSTISFDYYAIEGPGSPLLCETCQMTSWNQTGRLRHNAPVKPVRGEDMNSTNDVAEHSASTDCYPFWKVRGYGCKIVEVEIERQTGKSVWVREPKYSGDGYTVRRHPKESTYDRYFASHEAAVSWVRGKLSKAVDLAEKKLTDAKERLAKFNAEIDG